jgi:hypothetical protein
MDFNRRTFLKSGTVVGGVGFAGSELLRSGNADPSRSEAWGDQDSPEPYEDYDVHIVSKRDRGFDTIQAAVNAATERDLVLIERGVYHEKVNVTDTPKLNIRGVDRNEVIIDGEFERSDGIISLTNDIVVENLTVRNHTGNGVYWNRVRGYRGSYLTAYNNIKYGIYAFNSRYGRFEHCYASGHDDAGFYIGESQPASAVITDCTAENNAMGYSGTNAGGNLVIKDSVWKHNMSGLVPNTLDSQQGAPQGHIAGGIRMENNEVRENNNLEAPAYPLGYTVFGNGIILAGGVRNDVVDNDVSGQEKYGIVISPILDSKFYLPRDNAVVGNNVSNSGRADLALAAPASGNVFSDNKFSSSRPAFLERRDGSIGDVWLFIQMLKDYVQADSTGNYHAGEVGGLPKPDNKEGMENPINTPPRTPYGDGDFTPLGDEYDV